MKTAVSFPLDLTQTATHMRAIRSVRLPSLISACLRWELPCSGLRCTHVSTTSLTELNFSLPHSSCFRWWSIGLLRYTHAPLILHRLTILYLIHLSIFFSPHVLVFLLHGKNKSQSWFSHCFDTIRGRHARLPRGCCHQYVRTQALCIVCTFLVTLHLLCLCVSWILFQFILFLLTSFVFLCHKINEEYLYN